MYRYIIKRVLLVIPTLLGAAALVFVLMRLIPGDVCVVRLGSGGNTLDPKAIALCHAELGMDRPVVIQFVDFVWGILRLDFGTSMWSGNAVTAEIWARLPISLEIAILATVIAIAIAIPLGALSALKQNTWIDVLVRIFAVGGIATPSFWLGIMSVLVVLNVTSAVFGKPWMPPIEYVPIWRDPVANLSMAFLPAVTVGYRYAAVSMRMTRSAMLEVMQEDYIRTARAKGLAERAVVLRHGFRNALVPVITVLGLDTGNYLTGSILTETIFGWPGLGRYVLTAIDKRDLPAIQGSILFMSVVFVVVNLVTDLLYAKADPRIAYD